jgi:hypothetical protein
MPSLVSPRATDSPTDQLRLLPISLQLESHPLKGIIFFQVLRTPIGSLRASATIQRVTLFRHEHETNKFFRNAGKLHSPDSDWLRAIRPKGRSSSPGRVKNILFSTSSRPALGPTQPPIQWVPEGSFPGGKAAGASSWPLTSSQCRPRSRKYGSIHPLPHTPSWRSA